MDLIKGDVSPPVIVFLDVEAWEEDILKRLCPPAWRARYYAEEADRIDLGEIGDAQIISAFIYSDLDAPRLRQLPLLRMIATRSTGYDHIDTAYCRERNVVVSNVPSYGANTVAEHTFALLLSLSRNIYQARERTLRNDFSFHGLQGFDLMGKVLGVIGTGQIGQHVIRIAKGFEMQVLANDPHQDTAASERLGKKICATWTLRYNTPTTSACRSCSVRMIWTGLPRHWRNAMPARSASSPKSKPALR